MGGAGADYCFACQPALRPAIASPPRAAARIADAVPSRSTIARPGECSSPRRVARCMGPWLCNHADVGALTIAFESAPSHACRDRASTG